MWQSRVEIEYYSGYLKNPRSELQATISPVVDFELKEQLPPGNISKKVSHPQGRKYINYIHMDACPGT